MFHDWHLEIFVNPSDHAPQVGDPTPIICEITPRTERAIYRDGVRIQSLTGFFRWRCRFSGGQTIWIEKRFVVHANEKLAALLELERITQLHR